jgi:membrane-associated phospholipid phosphatase
VAQSPDRERRSFVRTFVSDEWRMWTSPFRRSSYSSSAAPNKYVMPFALIGAALIATDHRTSEAASNSEQERVWSGRVSQIGAAYTLAGGSGTMFLIGKLAGDEHAAETGWLALQALAHAETIGFGLKQVTNRARPVQKGGGVGFWKGGDSFPSGHATNSFAVATVFAYEYRDHIAVPITAYSLAGLVSASRVTGRKHWLSDVFVGGSTGFLVGRYVYKQHHDPRLSGHSGKRARAARFIPVFGFGPQGPALMWQP